MRNKEPANVFFRITVVHGMLQCLQVIDTLVEIGHISSEKAQDAKLIYEKLHTALVAAMSQEKALLEQAKQLAKEAQVRLKCQWQKRSEQLSQLLAAAEH